MKTIFRILIVLPFAALILLFAIANRHLVTVSFDPFPGTDIGGPQITAPLFIVLTLAGMAGVLAGGMAVWFRQGRFRKAARIAKAEAQDARADVASLRTQLLATSTPQLPPPGRSTAA